MTKPLVPNTISDFINTATDRTSSIICPACGSELGTSLEGSFEYMFTDAARMHLDNKIDEIRRFIEGVERTLERRNYAYERMASDSTPYDREQREYIRSLNADGITINYRGEHEGSVGAIEASKFRDAFDPYDWARLYATFPLIGDAVQETAKTENILLTGMEPSGVGMVWDIIAEQREVSSLRKKLGITSAHNRTAARGAITNITLPTTPEEDIARNIVQLREILQECCPFYAAYIDAYEESLGTASSRAPTSSSPGSGDLHGRKNGIKRARLLLAILLGHKSQKVKDYKDLCGEAITMDTPYHLPERTYVPIELLTALINSRTLLSATNVGLSPDFISRLVQKADDEDLERDAKWFDEIKKVVHFTCAHKPTGSAQACGWYPKEKDTHPIVLLGSPGVGKSSLMMAGLATFNSAATSIGCIARPEGVLARDSLRELDEKNRAGSIEPPTRRGAKNRIELAVAPLESPFEQVHFVFLDVAGEDVRTIVSGEAPNPDLRRILRNARTIVFLFDFTVEPSIREILPDKDEYHLWRQVRESFRRTDDERKDADKKGASKGGGGISLDQFVLMTELIHLLRGEIGEEKLGETTFICVVPKADLFATSYLNADMVEDGEQYFLDEFFKRMEELNILVSSPHAPGEGLPGKYSVFSQEVMQNALGECANISNIARECLPNIGRALPRGTSEASRMALSDRVSKGLIQYVENCFGKDNCFFLPVSPLGVDPRDTDGTPRHADNRKVGGSPAARSLGHRPNQKLAEYVFLIPVARALGLGQPEGS